MSNSHHHDCHCEQCQHEHMDDLSANFIAKHDPQGKAMQFPCKFPIKIFGRSEGDFLKYAFDLVSVHVPELKLEHCRQTSSKKGNFVSVTVEIVAQSREQLDKIYADLKNDEKVVAML
ncbi:DUF493 domain-containing protein [bacterium]|nr:DUF493 domain-containing protein [bacterium]